MLDGPIGQCPLAHVFKNSGGIVWRIYFKRGQLDSISSLKTHTIHERFLNSGPAPRIRKPARPFGSGETTAVQTLPSGCLISNTNEPGLDDFLTKKPPAGLNGGGRRRRGKGKGREGRTNDVNDPPQLQRPLSPPARLRKGEAGEHNPTSIPQSN